VKAIETVYNGYRFRSRLEARWAVFFEWANIEYQYEPEGFVVNDRPYLADFYISMPGFKSGYVEIKPRLPINSYIKMIKSSPVSWVIVGYPHVAMDEFHNIINSGYYVLFDCHEYDRLGCKGVFVSCRRCNNICIESRQYHVFDNQSELSDGGGYGFCCTERTGWTSDVLIKSYNAASQSRFEHGQVGAPSEW